tara:strand:- start:2378 stop:3019 length:642 start_codon:yes stop_codon:yes gene_type:complete
MPRENTKIARDETVKTWRVAREVLAADPTREQLEDIFERFLGGRLESRYFEPIRKLNELCYDDGEGFAIVTLYCSIIEFLASIRTGQNYQYLDRKSSRKVRPDEYCDSKRMFVDFLRKQAPFKEVFQTKRDAKDFYKNVRCGLVHEARIKGNWRIRSKGNSKVAIDVAKKKIYRRLLPDLFSDYIASYKDQFLLSKALQESFLRKFDYLCELH